MSLITARFVELYNKKITKPYISIAFRLEEILEKMRTIDRNVFIWHDILLSGNNFCQWLWEES